MPAELVVGVIGTCIAVVTGVIAYLQLRRTPRLPADGPPDATGARPSADGAPRVRRWALRPPTARLPQPVRGRDALIDALTALVDRPDGRAHVLAGLGGTGKSTVALRIADLAARRGRPVWWVPAPDPATLASFLLGIAEELGATADEVAEATAQRRDPAELLWAYLDRRSGWVLVIDDVDDLDVLAVDSRPVSEGTGWIRPTSSGLLVVTSRDADQRHWGPHVEVHRVGWLSEEDGARVLLDLAPHAGTGQEAGALSARLGGLPLALRHAGLHLASPFARERTFTEYRHALDERFPELMADRSAGPRAAVVRTWELSLNHLTANGTPQARPLLTVLSLFAAGVPVPVAVLDHHVLAAAWPGGSPDRVAGGLDALRATGLVEVRAAQVPGVLVHPLVAEALRRSADADGAARTGAPVAVTLLSAAVGGLSHEDPRDWPSWTRLLPHVHALLDNASAWLDDRALGRLAGSAERTATALLWQGADRGCEELVDLALARTSALARDQEVIIDLQFLQANVLLVRGEGAMAERRFRRLLDAQRVAYGLDHPDSWTTRHFIARALAEQGRHREAEAELRAVLAARTAMLGVDHPDTILSRQFIARQMAAQGRHREAEEAFREVLAARVEVLGPEHLNTLVTREHLARALMGQGRMREAESELRDLLAARTRLLGPEHSATRATREALDSCRERP